MLSPCSYSHRGFPQVSSIRIMIFMRFPFRLFRSVSPVCFHCKPKRKQIQARPCFSYKLLFIRSGFPANPFSEGDTCRYMIKNTFLSANMPFLVYASYKFIINLYFLYALPVHVLRFAYGNLFDKGILQYRRKFLNSCIPFYQL